MIGCPVSSQTAARARAAVRSGSHDRRAGQSSAHCSSVSAQWWSHLSRRCNDGVCTVGDPPRTIELHNCGPIRAPSRPALHCTAPRAALTQAAPRVRSALGREREDVRCGSAGFLRSTPFFPHRVAPHVSNRTSGREKKRKGRPPFSFFARVTAPPRRDRAGRTCERRTYYSRHPIAPLDDVGGRGASGAQGEARA